MGITTTDLIVDFADRLPRAILDDYFTRRQQWYVRRHGLPAKFGARDAFDDDSYIVLASDGVQCLGGVRATVSTPACPRRLPMELMCPGLDLATMFPEFDLRRNGYAEFSRLIVTADGGALGLGNTVALRLFRFLWMENPRPDVRYAFSIAPHNRLRMYRSLAVAHDLGHATRDIPEILIPPSLRPFGPQAVQAYTLVKGGHS